MRFRVTLNNPTLGSLILTKEPKGLAEIYPTIKRGENHGLTNEIDVKLEFYCNGAGKEFIDQVRDEQGIDAEVTITIEAFCGCDAGEEAPDYSIDYSDDYGSFIGGTCDEDFAPFYDGLLDLKTWSTDDIFTKVNINPAGILQTVKNRLDTKVDLFATETIEGTAITPYTFAPYDLNLHSRKIFGQGQWIVDPDNSFTYNTLNAHVVPLEVSLEEIDTMMTPASFDLGAPCYVNGLPNSRTITLTGRIVISVQQSSEINNPSGIATYNYSGGFNIVLRILDESLAAIYSENLHTEAGFLSGDAHIFDFNVSTTLIVPAGNYIEIIYNNTYEATLVEEGGSVTSRVQNYIYFDTTEVSISGLSVTAATTAKAFAIFEAGAQISRVITNQLDSFRSNYFGRTDSEPFSYDENGCGSFRAITNGFMIRGFPTTGDNARTIRMSMNDFFKGFNPIDNLGLAIEKDGDDYYIVIEPKEYFYDSSNIMMVINHVRGLKRSEAPEYYYSRVNVGYEKWETEFTNGLQEQNSKRQYDTGIKAVNNDMNLISPLVSAGYRLEIARRKQYAQFFTEDSEYDEENFIVCLNRSVDGSGIPTDLDTAEKDENFDTVNNVISPETAYNLRLSPARNLLRHSNIINAGLLKSTGREIKFMSGEGNYKMESELSSDTCSGRWNNNLFGEGQNIQHDDADNTDNSPIWIPEILEFGYPVTFSQYQSFVANPNGVFEISETDTDHIKGYILDFKYKPGDVSEFKLLRAYP